MLFWPIGVAKVGERMKPMEAGDERKRGIRAWLALALWLAFTFGAAATGAFVSTDGWYATLAKPTWNPPNWVFGPVWTALYIMMAVAAWLVWRQGGWRRQRRALALYVAQWALNALWTPLFFGLRRPDLAFACIVLLLIAIALTMSAFRPARRLAALLLLPYAAWVGFATVLNFAIWRLNVDPPETSLRLETVGSHDNGPTENAFDNVVPYAPGPDDPANRFEPIADAFLKRPDIEWPIPAPAFRELAPASRLPVSIFRRSPSPRGFALGRFGGGGHTEGAVLRAMRWFKHVQEADGSWRLDSGDGSATLRQASADDGAPIGMTALALAVFLTNGATPASREFGNTVRDAIRFLLRTADFDRAFADGKAADFYSHFIAAHTLAEAYEMTRIPAVGEAATRAVQALVRIQQPNGGFDYKRDADRDQAESDTSLPLTVWAARAFVSAELAGLRVEGLDVAKSNAAGAIKLCYRLQADGGLFTYRASDRAPRRIGLTGTAVHGLLLLGEGDSAEARHGIAWLREQAKFDWDRPDSRYGENPVYYWYGIAQAMFLAGPETWQEWNRQFSLSLVERQRVQPKAVETPWAGKADMGYWEAPADTEWCQSRAYVTALCAQQLMIYYAWLSPKERRHERPWDESAPKPVESRDLDIDYQL